MTKTLRLLIRGRVQGVGYRESMRMAAQKLGCTGWVLNRRDGSVEAVVQGPTTEVDALIAWAHHGPPAARVEGIEIHAEQGTFERFEIGRSD